MPRNKHKRNWEHVAVVHWLFHWVVARKGAICVFECLSANLALQEFFQAINFRLLEQLNTNIQSLHVFYYLHGKFVNCIIRLLFCMKFFAYCRFPNIFIHVVYPNSWVERPRLLPTFKAWLLSTCLFVFSMRRNFNFMVWFEVIILKNQIERAF